MVLYKMFVIIIIIKVASFSSKQVLPNELLEQLASVIVGIEDFVLCLIGEDGHNTLE